MEVLAKNLGVTKGGFYRRFRDRAALLEAMLQHWSAGRIAAIERHTSLDGATARERLKALIALYSERMNTEGMAVELAIRQWARSDELAANAVASVDVGAAEECRASLSRHRPAGGGSRRAGVPVLLLRVRPEPAVSRTRPAQARATGGEVGRNIAPRIVGAAEASGRARVGCCLGRALQLLGAFAVIAAALLDPLQAAIAVGGLVGVVLIHAGVHAGLAGGLLGIFRIDGVRIDRGA